MIRKALVAFGSRYGATRRIAEYIGELLSENEFEVMIIDLKKENAPHDMTEYDLFVVGSGIKMGKWTKESESFLNKVPKTKPLGLFVSCSYAMDDENDANEKYISTIASKYGLTPVASFAFGPIFDLSSNSGLGFLSKKMVKQIAISLAKKKGIDLDESGVNDFVEWEKVDDFVASLT